MSSPHISPTLSLARRTSSEKTLTIEPRLQTLTPKTSRCYQIGLGHSRVTLVSPRLLGQVSFSPFPPILLTHLAIATLNPNLRLFHHHHHRPPPVPHPSFFFLGRRLRVDKKSDRLSEPPPTTRQNATRQQQQQQPPNPKQPSRTSKQCREERENRMEERQATRRAQRAGPRSRTRLRRGYRLVSAGGCGIEKEREREGRGGKGEREGGRGCWMAGESGCQDGWRCCMGTE